MDHVALSVAIGAGVLVVVILGLLLGRELVCWYFKINERLVVQKNLDQNVWSLLKQLEKMGPRE